MGRFGITGSKELASPGFYGGAALGLSALAAVFAAHGLGRGAFMFALCAVLAVVMVVCTVLSVRQRRSRDRK